MEDYYEILGVKKDASREEIARAYKMHFLKYQKAGLNKTEEQEQAFRKIEQAYNELMGYNVHIEDYSSTKQNPVLNFFHIDQDKFENFWMYNRAKIFIILAVVILLGTFTLQIINNTANDLNVAFVGNFKLQDDNGREFDLETGVITAYIKQVYTFVKNPLVNFYRNDPYSADNPSLAQVNKQAFVVHLTAGEIDMLILDEDTFKDYASKGILYILDDTSLVRITNSSLLQRVSYTDAKNVQVQGIYGVEITNGSFIKDSYIVSKTGEGKIIACIVRNSKNKDKALKTLNAMLQINHEK